MKQSKVAGRLLVRLRYIRALSLQMRQGALREYGWWKSRGRMMPVDAAGRLLPHYTYSCIEFLEPRIEEGFEVFEYGCGYSTLWWAERVKRVVSCEHSREWYDRIGSIKPANVRLLLRGLQECGGYLDAIEGEGLFDVIIIDGRERVDCAAHATGALKQGGIIIWDDTERDKYRRGYKYLESEGFRRLDFWGMGPVNIEKWCTTVWYRSDNCLGI